MQIADLMTPDLEVVTPDYTVGMAAQMMADLDCELLPVIEDDCLVGAITGCDRPELPTELPGVALTGERPWHQTANLKPSLGMLLLGN